MLNPVGTPCISHDQASITGSGRQRQAYNERAKGTAIRPMERERERQNTRAIAQSFEWYRQTRWIVRRRRRARRMSERVRARAVSSQPSFLLSFVPPSFHLFLPILFSSSRMVFFTRKLFPAHDLGTCRSGRRRTETPRGKQRPEDAGQ